MRFDLDNLNPATRFYFDDDNQDEGFVDLRVATPSVLTDIRKKAAPKKTEYKKGSRFEYVDLDENLYDRLFWDFVIPDWGLKAEDGSSIEPTAANKVKLVTGHLGFAAFVNEKLKILNDGIEAIAKASKKN